MISKRPGGHFDITENGQQEGGQIDITECDQQEGGQSHDDEDAEVLCYICGETQQQKHTFLGFADQPLCGACFMLKEPDDDDGEAK
ncbi:hypothetical protein FRX31_027391, partial [Thalictrum thalictroides]